MDEHDAAKESHGAKPAKEATATQVEAEVAADGTAGSAVDAKLRKLGTRRGVETLFRSMYRVHMDLTAIADNKANIMITVNGLMLSILLASAGPTSDGNRWLLFPIGAALLTSLGAMAFAVLAAKPRLNRDPTIGPQTLNRRANLLFFGNYTALEEDDFVTELSAVVVDAERVYHGMMRDLYEIGSVLNHKFAMLERSYNIFLAGLLVSVAMLMLTLVLTA